MSKQEAIVVPSDLSILSQAELRKLENKIARKHSGMFPWAIVIWAFGNLACWLAIWALVLTDAMPLWLGFIIATINLSLVYCPPMTRNTISSRVRGRSCAGSTNWSVMPPAG